MWAQYFKEANVNINVIATGAGAGLQQLLWSVPGSSAYFDGADFPYSPERHTELVGFTPEHYCSAEDAVDLASAAYMRAYKFGGKQAVGLGLTASVASTRMHRGEHRIHICVMTDTKVNSMVVSLPKEMGADARFYNGIKADHAALDLLEDTILNQGEYTDSTELAKERFFLRPFFTANGTRLDTLPFSKHHALMPGAYNPPHEGHFRTAEQVKDDYNRSTVFEITAEPPHKAFLSVQELLQRAKNLQGHDRFFTRKTPFYIDKARAYPGVPIILGADAMVRILDPKWGLDLPGMFYEFMKLNTNLLVAGRLIEDKFVTCDDILLDLKTKLSRNAYADADWVIKPVSGRLDISSTELRAFVHGSPSKEQP